MWLRIRKSPKYFFLLDVVYVMFTNVFVFGIKDSAVLFPKAYKIPSCGFLGKSPKFATLQQSVYCVIWLNTGSPASYGRIM
jgi:hypothetical protein